MSSSASSGASGQGAGTAVASANGRDRMVEPSSDEKTSQLTDISQNAQTTALTIL